MSKAKSKPTTFISYLRVSTRGQGQSGLGLESQRQAVKDFITNGDTADLIAEFVEIETGKRNGRPELEKALAACRKRGATLVVAKLDRLTRNTRFLLGIAESGVDVVFCDLPEVPPGPMGKFFLTLMAAVAELEAGLISQRTKDALAAAKAKGTKLGNPRKRSTPEKKGRDEAGEMGRQQLRDKADRFAANVIPIIWEIEASGVTSHLGIAKALNARGIPTARGGEWYAATVRNIRNRPI